MAINDSLNSVSLICRRSELCSEVSIDRQIFCRAVKLQSKMGTSSSNYEDLAHMAGPIVYQLVSFLLLHDVTLDNNILASTHGYFKLDDTWTTREELGTSSVFSQKHSVKVSA